MINKKVIKGFSKFSKDQKIDLITSAFNDQEEAKTLLESFWHSNEDVQKIFDEFSENTLSNFYFPFGVAPNFLINGQMYVVPMVIEESSVVAAASNSARFWGRQRRISQPNHRFHQNWSRPFFVERQRQRTTQCIPGTSQADDSAGETSCYKYGKARRWNS
jgi:hypothetical protein